MSYITGGPGVVGMTNPIFTRFAAGEPAIGLGVQLAQSAEIVLVARETGHDYIWIDSQHGLFDLGVIKALALTALSAGVAAVVRVRGVDDPFTAQLLDAGVTGVVFPGVETADEARRAVSTSRFAPLGTRSLAGAYPQFGYRRVPPDEAMATLQTNTVVVCMIETLLGLANVEEIAAVDGVDVVHLGMSDMLSAMGKTGAHGDPEIMAALDRVVAVTDHFGKHAGCGGNRNVEAQVEALRRGVRFLTTHTDVGLINAGAREWIQALRRGFEERSG
jgi:2-keto-3-deoxy-L-rhamnonate aldolase RhmA